ncbi:RNA polymerase sigma factor [Fimbriiglobus ruber]|nr:sigma-70 family RNA polymerase sigma factor [Fimbriiglobus ruber]
MSESDAFQQLIDRARRGDNDAATELVRRFEPLVRREVRTLLRRHRCLPLDRIFDSADICQSVMARLFDRALPGVELDGPAHLTNLLLVMTRNRFLQHSRNNQARCRDIRKTHVLGGVDFPEPASRGTPIEEAVEHELLEIAKARLTPEEWSLADRRADGLSWNEIAGTMGGSPDGRRMQLGRAEARIADEFGMAAGVEAGQ